MFTRCRTNLFFIVLIFYWIFIQDEIISIVTSVNRHYHLVFSQRLNYAYAYIQDIMSRSNINRGNVHSWFTSVCYTSRCNVSEVSIDLSDVECMERSNALAVSNGRCAGNRSSDGWLRFRKLPIRYRGAAICKNDGRRWLMHEWLENSILPGRKKKKKWRASHETSVFCGYRRNIFELAGISEGFNWLTPRGMPRNKCLFVQRGDNKNTVF